jgi:hypothetical protein
VAKRDDKKEESLWRQAVAGDVHALARLLNEHYDAVHGQLRKLNRLQTVQADVVRQALDDAIVELLLTQPEPHKAGVAAAWYDLAKVLASRRRQEIGGEGQRARGGAIELLAAAKQEAVKLREEQEAAGRREKKRRVEGRGVQLRYAQSMGRIANAGQRFRSGAVLNCIRESLQKNGP